MQTSFFALMLWIFDKLGQDGTFFSVVLGVAGCLANYGSL